MKIIYILLIILIVLALLTLILLKEYNKINIIRIKINNSNEKLTINLKKRYDILLNLIKNIKKYTKESYLNEFNKISIEEINNYELDRICDDTLDYLIKVIEDNKNANNKETKSLLIDIKNINQKINANKKYFNKNNHELCKLHKGSNIILFKFFKINVMTSYEIKEPTD